MDWLLGRRRASEPPRVEPPDLQPIRLYSAETVFAASVHPGGERITDILQRGDELLVLPQGADHQDPDAWLAVNPDALLAVVPPPHVSPPELRLHRQREEVEIRTGPYRITGTAHLRPGQEQDPFVRATRPFLPLTDALVQRADGPPERFDVVIVNLRLMQGFQEV
jgi:hypothetical protein